MAEQFDHDLAADPASYVAGIVMLAIIVVLTLFVVFWTPASVVVPAWFVLLLLLLLLLLPVSWALQRPWIITAFTKEPVGTEGELWEGIVRGMGPAREETRRVVDDLRRSGIPDNPNGPLSRVGTSAAPYRDS